MRKTLITLTLAIAVLVSPTLTAQSQRTPLDTSVKLVNDRRSDGYFAKMSVVVELPDISAAELTAIRLVIQSAVDDTGRTLFEASEEEPEFFPVQRRMSPDPKTPASFEIGLMSPAREAVTLKEVSGEVDLYMPSRDPDAVMTIPNVYSSAGKPIAHKSLKAMGVEITVIDPKKREEGKEEAVKARAEELKAEGYEEDNISWMVEDFAEMYFVPGESELALEIVDPDSRIQDLKLLDGAGEIIEGYDMFRDDFKVLATYGDPLGRDIGLQVSVRTAKTVSQHTFSLKDVALP